MNIICGKLSFYLGQDMKKIVCIKIKASAETINVCIFFVL